MISSSAWIIWALLSAVFAACTALFAKIGVQNIDADLATLIRTAIIFVVLCLFVWSTGKLTGTQALTARNWLFLTLSALATGASWVCYFRALQLGDVAKVAPVDKLSVVLVAIFATLFLGEHPSLQEWTGIVLVAAGILVLTFKF
jgi:bacterial/archaeal transporter family protein